MLRSTRLFSRLSLARRRHLRVAVSLHSHTTHSRESFAGLPWTPPLSPAQAVALESGQIHDLGLEPLVSLTDHDNIEAALHLRGTQEDRRAPISVEWSVPWRGAEMHLGIHNMPPARARQRMAALARFTTIPREYDLRDILDWLHDDPSTLLVWNHPLWDESGLGGERYRSVSKEFLRCYRPWIHALEVNGLRPWKENHRVMQWAAAEALPSISGGDRHGCEPNAFLNLTRAATFAEFVDEVREDHRSRVLVMPQYRHSLLRRLWANWPNRYNRRDETAIVSLPTAGGRLRTGTENA